MKLTNEVIKFCWKNREVLAEWFEKDDWNTRRNAWSRWRKFVDGVQLRLERLGLPRLDYSKAEEPEHVQEAVEAIQALADDGSVEALDALFGLAIISARGVRGMERRQYLKDHKAAIPWRLSPAEQHSAALVNTAAAGIKDEEVNKMLSGLDTEIHAEGDNPDGA